MGGRPTGVPNGAIDNGTLGNCSGAQKQACEFVHTVLFADDNVKCRWEEGQQACQTVPLTTAQLGNCSGAQKQACEFAHTVLMSHQIAGGDNYGKNWIVLFRLINMKLL
ncbi:hypothetical protein niasHS_008833 [Heterodera schachtii]|uniref:Uncharacterized protein n=1 Tax=Heterodera schachtii TaxID=97005 RepID=A0ABD2IXB9_HETSC